MRPGWVLFFVGAAAGVSAAQDQQLGARTKGMGGSYTAFEDDPVSIWLNPAGIATQPSQMALAYQTYTAYPVHRSRGEGDEVTTSVEAETIMVDPAIIPSYLGLVFQLGKTDSPLAAGICYARPYHLNYALDLVLDPDQTVFRPEDNVEQSFSRFRVALAKDFRFVKVGEEGWFTHVALGGGLDIGHTRWQFRSQQSGDTSDSLTGFGYGIGALVGLYDDTSTFKVNLGLAYQSGIEYDFNIETDIFPAFDMPQQLNAGLTFYMFEGTPLRATLDFQWIEWSETAEDPLFAGHKGFEDAVNFSVGLEYRIQLEEGIFLYPRGGYRRFDAPWSDENDLPMTGGYKLVLDTDGEAFNIGTLGLGLSWLSKEGQIRALDIAVDFGGDAFNAAAGLTYEF